MACREMNQLDTPAIEEGVDTDQKSIGPFTRKRCEGFVDLADCAGVDDLNLQSDSASCRFQVSQRRVDNRWVGWIDEHGNATSRRHYFTQKFQPFRRQFASEKIDSCQVTTRPGETRD